MHVPRDLAGHTSGTRHSLEYLSDNLNHPCMCHDLNGRIPGAGLQNAALSRDHKNTSLLRGGTTRKNRSAPRPKRVRALAPSMKQRLAQERTAWKGVKGSKRRRAGGDGTTRSPTVIRRKRIQSRWIRQSCLLNLLHT